MYYRTRLYLAAEWDGDRDLIEQLHSWNDSGYYSLHFSDAHDLKQCYDSSLPCTIKRSLADRMNGSKIFLLIVGDKTNSVTKGSCQFCKNYYRYSIYCSNGHKFDYSSFVQFECERAVKDNLHIIVLYNSYKIDTSKCPEILRDIGTHLPAYHFDRGTKIWNYQDIKMAIELSQ